MKSNLFNPKDVKYTATTGKGPGGTNRNRSARCITATHIPTGIQRREDGRSIVQNKRLALKGLEEKVNQHFADLKAADKKKKRDDKIKNCPTIRTYDYKHNTVKDHRSMKTADLKKFLNGKEDLREFSNED